MFLSLSLHMRFMTEFQKATCSAAYLHILVPAGDNGPVSILLRSDGLAKLTQGSIFGSRTIDWTKSRVLNPACLNVSIFRHANPVHDKVCESPTADPFLCHFILIMIHSAGISPLLRKAELSSRECRGCMQRRAKPGSSYQERTSSPMPPCMYESRYLLCKPKAQRDASRIVQRSGTLQRCAEGLLRFQARSGAFGGVPFC